MEQMTDRELLEFAAKAAGIEIVQWQDDCPRVMSGFPIPWNPLADDGDALRLMVNLRLEASIFRDHSTAYYASGWCDEYHHGEPYAATRRAIVRAAAAIGQSM